MVSIIVPARNNPDSTATCLKTLLYSVNRLKLVCEFILVDDHSDAEERILEVFLKHRAAAAGHVCKIVRAKKHQHYSGVFSAGLKLATQDSIFFISNDMMVTPNFLLVLLVVSSLSSDIGIVRGTSNHTDSHPEHQLKPPAPLKTYEEIISFSGTVFGANGTHYVEDKTLAGDALLLKRTLIDRIGVLDLRFFGYFGDIDFAMRAHLAGFRLVCAKGAWLHHDGFGHLRRDHAREPGTLPQDHTNRRMELVEKAYQKFRRKWSGDLPAHYALLKKLEFFDTARTNAAKVELKYDAPESFIDEFECH